VSTKRYRGGVQRPGAARSVPIVSCPMGMAATPALDGWSRLVLPDGPSNPEGRLIERIESWRPTVDGPGRATIWNDLWGITSEKKNDHEPVRRWRLVGALRGSAVAGIG